MIGGEGAPRSDAPAKSSLCCDGVQVCLRLRQRLGVRSAASRCPPVSTRRCHAPNPSPSSAGGSAAGCRCLPRCLALLLRNAELLCCRPPRRPLVKLALLICRLVLRSSVSAGAHGRLRRVILWSFVVCLREGCAYRLPFPLHRFALSDFLRRYLTKPCRRCLPSGRLDRPRIDKRRFGLAEAVQATYLTSSFYSKRIDWDGGPGTQRCRLTQMSASEDQQLTGLALSSKPVRPWARKRREAVEECVAGWSHPSSSSSRLLSHSPATARVEGLLSMHLLLVSLNPRPSAHMLSPLCRSATLHGTRLPPGLRLLQAVSDGRAAAWFKSATGVGKLSSRAAVKGTTDARP